MLKISINNKIEEIKKLSYDIDSISEKNLEE